MPALIVTADREDCLVASLVENCARRQHHAVDLLQDIVGMRGRGHSDSEIAAMTGAELDLRFSQPATRKASVAPAISDRNVRFMGEMCI